MNKEELIHQIRLKRSFLCVGLDTDIEKIPPHLLSLDDPIFEFNKQIIDATKQFCVAYKPNIAFYESIGDAGWKSLEKTFNYIPKDILTIADAKRGDIGNTSDMYAKSMFKNMDADAITVQTLIDMLNKPTKTEQLTQQVESVSGAINTLDEELAKIVDMVLLKNKKG